MFIFLHSVFNLCWISPQTPQQTAGSQNSRHTKTVRATDCKFQRVFQRVCVYVFGYSGSECVCPILERTQWHFVETLELPRAHRHRGWRELQVNTHSFHSDSRFNADHLNKVIIYEPLFKLSILAAVIKRVVTSRASELAQCSAFE